MTYRLQNLMLAPFLAMMLALSTLLLGLGSLSQNLTSGGYQLFERANYGIADDNSLTALEDFDYFAKIASECCNATNSVLPTPRKADNLAGGPLENATQVSGRFDVQGGPASGIAYRTDNQGNVTSYATYDANGNMTSRVDLDPNSAPHFDKATGQTIPAPHVVEYPINPYNGRTQTNQGVVRPANADDIP